MGKKDYSYDYDYDCDSNNNSKSNNKNDNSNSNSKNNKLHSLWPMKIKNRTIYTQSVPKTVPSSETIFKDFLPAQRVQKLCLKQLFLERVFGTFRVQRSSKRRLRPMIMERFKPNVCPKTVQTHKDCNNNNNNSSSNKSSGRHSGQQQQRASRTSTILINHGFRDLGE